MIAVAVACVVLAQPASAVRSVEVSGDDDELVAAAMRSLSLAYPRAVVSRREHVPADVMQVSVTRLGAGQVMVNVSRGAKQVSTLLNLRPDSAPMDVAESVALSVPALAAQLGPEALAPVPKPPERRVRAGAQGAARAPDPQELVEPRPEREDVSTAARSGDDALEQSPAETPGRLTAVPAGPQHASGRFTVHGGIALMSLAWPGERINLGAAAHAELLWKDSLALRLTAAGLPLALGVDPSAVSAGVYTFGASVGSVGRFGRATFEVAASAEVLAAFRAGEGDGVPAAGVTARLTTPVGASGRIGLEVGGRLLLAPLSLRSEDGRPVATGPIALLLAVAAGF